MDSGNSSSIQSSSGGVLGGCNGVDQEEYNSRADQSISALFNTNTNTNSTQLDPLLANYFTNSNPIWSSSKPQFTNPPQEHQQQQQISSPNTNMNTSKNPKKRSRASRRAPTTVLTTDTTNFRAMVQEFTGNPSTPFTGSLNLNPFHKSTQRFDLFGPSSSSSSSFPLKPFAHKLISPSSTHYLSSSIHQQNHVFNQNLTNPFLNTQSLTNPLSDQGVLLPKSKTLFDVERFGHVEGLHNIVDSSSSRQQNLDHCKNSEEGDHVLMRSINGGYNRERNDDSSGPSSSSALAPENNLTSTVRNEGMVELSWICSSD